MIKEGQNITYEEAKRAGWLIENEGALSGLNRWRYTTLISPDRELIATFYWTMASATVERAE